MLHMSSSQCRLVLHPKNPGTALLVANYIDDDFTKMVVHERSLLEIYRRVSDECVSHGCR